MTMLDTKQQELEEMTAEEIMKFTMDNKDAILRAARIKHYEPDLTYLDYDVPFSIYTTNNLNILVITLPHNWKIPKAPDVGEIYVAYKDDPDRPGFVIIKIGKSDQPSERMKAQSLTPLHTMMSKYKSLSEKMLHCIFYEKRKKGEYFYLSIDEIRFLANVDIIEWHFPARKSLKNITTNFNQIQSKGATK